jgi:hypothetical protein
MAEHPESVDERLARLQSATDGIRPSPAFADRVMLAIEQRAEIGWVGSALVAARPGIFAAVLAAAAAIGLAIHTDQEATEARAVASTAVGIDW